MTDIGLLGDRAKALAKLKETEGWKTLEEIYTEKREKYKMLIGKRALLHLYDFNQREIDYQAGWFAGIKDLLESPEKFESAVEAALQKQRLQNKEKEE